MAASLYTADPPETMRRVELEGLVLLYHRRSGLTHFLAPPAPQILDALATGPASAAEIAARIARAFDIESDDSEAAIAARLSELEAAGLVWRTASPSTDARSRQAQ
ncbi:MAG TPA: HPr-rel-A system PqqD family peptide chaperone [Allosphingosinicella sp.]|jgi:PqqD family protein of HPr-rel-A system|nr:HPr-rel-A system PqqD family peptide chaperone [Allosphingosinicella sp.]